MQELLQPKIYSKQVLGMIEKLGPLAVEIANRWVLGWPERVKGLLASGEYLESLKYQHEMEMSVLTSVECTGHLARHEIAELYGLSQSPPVPENKET